MRTLVTLALASVGAVAGCSAPTYSETTTTAEPTVTAEPAAPISGTKPAAGDDSDSDGDPRWAIKAEGLPPMLFTTMVRGDDGAFYAAGTFAGRITLGSDIVRSKGADDVILVRIEGDGHLTWVKSIGSSQQERAPKVTFVDGTVRILAETEGEVDCGSGGMGIWSTGMFFYCLYGADGTAMGGGTFPTGAP